MKAAKSVTPYSLREGTGIGHVCTGGVILRYPVHDRFPSGIYGVDSYMATSKNWVHGVGEQFAIVLRNKQRKAISPMLFEKELCALWRERSSCSRGKIFHSRFFRITMFSCDEKEAEENYMALIFTYISSLLEKQLCAIVTSMKQRHAVSPLLIEKQCYTTLRL